MFKKFILIAFSLALCFFGSISPVIAQQGCCSWHGGISHCASNGRYVCNDGTYSPSCTCGGGYYRAPTTPTYSWSLPAMDGNWTFKAKENKTYDVYFTWDEVEDCDGWSIALQKTAGGNPGPLVDTTANSFTFKNISPGNYYANIKCKTHGSWTNTRYWKIEVPKWEKPVPSPAPQLSPSPKTTANTTHNSDGDGGDALIFLGFSFVALAIAYFGVKLAVNFVVSMIAYLREHEEIWGILFLGGLIGGGILLSLISEVSSSTKSGAHSQYTCNCSKTCSSMTCSEAYFQLNECGCSARDGDRDGTPCEAQCR